MCVLNTSAGARRTPATPGTAASVTSRFARMLFQGDLGQPTGKRRPPRHRAAIGCGQLGSRRAAARQPCRGLRRGSGVRLAGEAEPSAASPPGERPWRMPDRCRRAAALHGALLRRAAATCQSRGSWSCCCTCWRCPWKQPPARVGAGKGVLARWRGAPAALWRSSLRLRLRRAGRAQVRCPKPTILNRMEPGAFHARMRLSNMHVRRACCGGAEHASAGGCGSQPGGGAAMRQIWRPACGRSWTGGGGGGNAQHGQVCGLPRQPGGRRRLRAAGLHQRRRPEAQRGAHSLPAIMRNIAMHKT